MGKAVLELVRQTGIEIVEDGNTIFWQGEYGGQTKGTAGWEKSSLYRGKRIQ